MKFAKPMLFATMIVTTMIAPWSVNSAAVSCEIHEPSVSLKERDDLGQSTDILGEIIRLAQAGTTKQAMERARAAGQLIVNFNDAATATAALEAAISLFRASHWNDVSRALLESAGEHLAPIDRQASIWDTDHVGLYAKIAQELENRTGPTFVNTMTRLERNILTSGVCPERAFFLRLRIGRELEKHNEPDIARARIDELSRAARSLRGNHYRGESLSWLALYHLTYLAIDLHSFEAALAYLREVTEKADEMAASGKFRSTDPAEFLEALPAYFRQERVRYYCPDVPGREPLSCPYER